MAYHLHASYTRKVSDGSYGNIMYSVSIDKHVDAASVQDAGQFAGTMIAEAEKQVLISMKVSAPGFVSGEAPTEVQAEIDEMANATEPAPQPPATQPVTPPTPEPTKPSAPAAPAATPVRRSLGEGGNVDQPAESKRVVKRDDPVSKPQIKLWADLSERYAKATTGLILEDAFDALKGKSFANTVKSKGEASDYITLALKIVADAEAKSKTPAPAKPVTPAPMKPAPPAPAKPTPQSPANPAPAKPAQNGLSLVSPRAAEFLGDMVAELAEHWKSDVKAHEFLEATIKDKNKGHLVDVTALSGYAAGKVIDVFKAKIAEARRNKVAATVSTGPGF